MENLRKTYLMKDISTNYIKIGKSINVLYREKTLQAEKPTIEVLFYVEEDIEKLLHSLFAEKRLRGEWFNLNQGDINFIDQILSQRGLTKIEFGLDDAISTKKRKNKPQITKKSPEVIPYLQNNPDYIILNNPMATPKLVREVGEKRVEQPITEIYIPKIFFEIISQLTPQHLELFEQGKETVTLTIHIGDFLNSISTGNSHSLYRHVIDCIDLLQTTQVKWKEKDKESGTAIITHYEYHPRQGKVDVVLYKEFVKQVVLVTQNEHFSFLKKYLHCLNNAQAIKLFPFFVSWRNKGMVELSVENFKKKFGYDTSGYKLFNNFKRKVLEPAITEINEKTDLIITYKLLGDNLTGIRPRVIGLQFFITEKVKQKELPLQQTEKAVFEYIKTPPQPTVLITQELQNDYLTDILRVFLLFEPQSTAENVKGFLSAFDNQKSVLEACLYAEQERLKGHEIKNFRGYLVAGIPKGLGAGLLEQKNKEQQRKQEIEQIKKAEKDKILQLDSLLKQADAVREAYRKAINDVLKNTATDADKENVADILRGQSHIYANRRLEDFRKPMFISTYITKFIETYPKRFEKVQNEYALKFEAIMSDVKKLDSSKYKVLFY